MSRTGQAPTFTVDAVRRYYDTHTSAFVALGQGGRVGAMHRAVWAPGVASRADAFRYVDDRIADIVRTTWPSEMSVHLVDLGCGVGGSLCAIAQQLPITGTGVTLSARQAALAAQRIAAAGLSDRVSVVAGDYLDLAAPVRAAHLVFAIESFVHAVNPRRFLAQCARLLHAGGVLVLCDDFRRAAASTESRGVAATERFCRGWHVNTLIERESLVELAAHAGFVLHSATDLSSWVEIGRPRDRLADLLVAPLDRLPWRWKRLDPWIGGSALQACLRNGWIGYDFLVFTRVPDCAAEFPEAQESEGSPVASAPAPAPRDAGA